MSPEDSDGGAVDVSQLIGGMGEAIYTAIESRLSTPFQQAIDDAIEARDAVAEAQAKKILQSVQGGWDQLAEAIAEGIITYVVSGIEISVVDMTVPGGSDTHIHVINLSTAESDWSAMPVDDASE